MRRKHIIALLLSIVLLVAVLFSIGFIAFESNHLCDDEHCNICLEMQACGNFIQNLSQAFAVISLLFIVGNFSTKIYRHIIQAYKDDTPISLKVKLLN